MPRSISRSVNYARRFHTIREKNHQKTRNKNGLEQESSFYCDPALSLVVFYLYLLPIT